MKREELLLESIEDDETSNAKQRDAAGSQLFTNKGKPKVFSWGDAALTANIASEKVSSILKKFITFLYILYIHYISIFILIKRLFVYMKVKRSYSLRLRL